MLDQSVAYLKFTQCTPLKLMLPANVCCICHEKHCHISNQHIDLFPFVLSPWVSPKLPLLILLISGFSVFLYNSLPSFLIYTDDGSRNGSKPSEIYDGFVICVADVVRPPTTSISIFKITSLCTFAQKNRNLGSVGRAIPSFHFGLVRMNLTFMLISTSLFSKTSSSMIYHFVNHCMQRRITELLYSYQR